MKKVLTIAGSDCSGGAGIQADLKTMTAHGVYGMSVITALTAQNTTGVQGIFSIPGEFVAKQLDSVFSDIRPDAVKIGMMSNVEIIETVAERLKHYEFTNIVLDPVMVSTSRHRLLEPSAEEALIRILLPMARILTPNLPEATVLAHRDDITNRDEMLEAAKVIATETGAAILVKGGHLSDCADDLLYDHGNVYWYSAPRIDTDNTHGTGCTLSSAIASGLALGMDLNTAVASAKEYITGALRNDPHLGHGNGPLNHCYRIG
ncbi:MAG: bifunctional hydroxymethylpyrimidine kinase/phosphomethylpyrimidine kinase [Victivallales bacterium]|nr:bifunctional hydroxymethylpyrimidine kinase/phosphomethylpyrimidine kinase [Victivallales bacterium]